MAYVHPNALHVVQPERLGRNGKRQKVDLPRVLRGHGARAWNRAAGTTRAARFVALLALAGTLGVAPGPTPAERTAAYMQRARPQPERLYDFLMRMPKGGDLHHHLTGSVYAESYIDYAIEDGDCIDAMSFAIVAPPCSEPATLPAAQAVTDFVLRNHVIDALSIRNFHATALDEDVRLHFFATFERFDRVTNGHWGEMFAEVVHRAATENEIYLETMLTPDQGEVLHLATQVRYTDDFAALRSALLAAGLRKAVADGRHNLDIGEAGMRERFRCGTSVADVGCGLTLRFQYQVLRAFGRASVFAQMLAGFEMARVDRRVVAINLVQSQDEFNALHDFTLHMRMLDYLHRVYPHVHISLHAGELTPGEAKPEELWGSHIRQSIEIGHAERIGHGLDIVYERDAPRLLAKMARNHILVEDCLFSHEVVRGMYGRDNVLPIYLRNHVPIALATDDEAVVRSDLTDYFLRAVVGYGVDYPTLKTFARNSIRYAFVDPATKHVLEARLETEFAHFESNF
jgi:adenosine deaminase